MGETARAERVAARLRRCGYEARVETAERVRFYAPQASRPSFVKLMPGGGFDADNAGLKAIRLIREALEGAEESA